MRFCNLYVMIVDSMVAIIRIIVDSYTEKPSIEKEVKKKITGPNSKNDVIIICLRKRFEKIGEFF